MGDVNTRIQDFFWKGKQQGQEEILDYMDQLAAHYANTSVKPNETLGDIIMVLRSVMQTQLKIQRTER
jgi:hypothetical protein